jgi:predicted CXXCH cytochrome family protein
VPRAADRPRRPTRRAALYAAGLAIAATWGGCSVQKHYKTLSLFFDGVPNPDAQGQLTAAERLAGMRSSPTYAAHQPYAQEQCSECHGASFELTAADSGVCLKCHEHAPQEHREMHGPVAAVACLWCHEPHESAHPALLKAEPNQVCGQCHLARMLDTRRVPEHADGARSCLECHSGHGGERRFFLRAGAGG